MYGGSYGINLGFNQYDFRSAEAAGMIAGPGMVADSVYFYGFGMQEDPRGVRYHDCWQCTNNASPHPVNNTGDDGIWYSCGTDTHWNQGYCIWGGTHNDSYYSFPLECGDLYAYEVYARDMCEGADSVQNFFKNNSYDELGSRVWTVFPWNTSSPNGGLENDDWLGEDNMEGTFYNRGYHSWGNPNLDIYAACDNSGCVGPDGGHCREYMYWMHPSAGGYRTEASFVDAWVSYPGYGYMVATFHKGSPDYNVVCKNVI